MAEPPALLTGARSDDDEARACVARDPSRAGLAVRQTVAPDPTTRSADGDGCASGEAVDDWALIRLDLGGIGRLPPRQHRR